MDASTAAAQPVRKPRSVTGGHSARYEARRAARGSTQRYAGGWTPASACRVLEALHADSSKKGKGLYQNTLEVLLDDARLRAVVAAAASKGAMSKPEERLAGEQLAHYAERARGLAAQLGGAATSSQAAVKAVLHALFKALRARRKEEAATVAPLVVPQVARGPPTFAGWLSAAPWTERSHDRSGCRAVDAGIAKWFPHWLKQPAVICYGNFVGRVQKERLSHDGPVGPLFASGLVRTVTLPTLTANGGKQYIVVSPGEPSRFMTVAEVARAFITLRPIADER
jgi:hypothetical protein